MEEKDFYTARGLSLIHICIAKEASLDFHPMEYKHIPETKCLERYANAAKILKY